LGDEPNFFDFGRSKTRPVHAFRERIHGVREATACRVIRKTNTFGVCEDVSKEFCWSS
jgi:hypothetical protein